MNEKNDKKREIRKKFDDGEEEGKEERKKEGCGKIEVGDEKKNLKNKKGK